MWYVRVCGGERREEDVVRDMLVLQRLEEGACCRNLVVVEEGRWILCSLPSLL